MYAHEPGRAPWGAEGGERQTVWSRSRHSRSCAALTFCWDQQRHAKAVCFRRGVHGEGVLVWMPMSRFRPMVYSCSFGKAKRI